ncbi:putative bacteriophage protein [Shigella sonnei str. Moseley]|nr:putative bacteriophage protein [Shigella sonnei str. Moseley]
MDWPTIKAGRNALWIELEGVEYAFPDPQTQNERNKQDTMRIFRCKTKCIFGHGF